MPMSSNFIGSARGMWPGGGGSARQKSGMRPIHRRQSSSGDALEEAAPSDDGAVSDEATRVRRDRIVAAQKFGAVAGTYSHANTTTAKHHKEAPRRSDERVASRRKWARNS